MGLLCQFSFGFAVMNRPVSYTVVNGTVVNTEGDDVRTAANVFFHLSPSSVPLGLALGIGFGSDNLPDLYLGGTLRFFDPVLLNFGAVWQRERMLPAGVKAGDPVPPDFDASTLDKKYTVSFFGGLSISP